MRIKTSWVALSVVVLAAGLLLVASLWHSLFSGGQQSVVPERSPPPGTSVSAQPTASPATPSPARLLRHQRGRQGNPGRHQLRQRHRLPQHGLPRLQPRLHQHQLRQCDRHRRWRPPQCQQPRRRRQCHRHQGMRHRQLPRHPCRQRRPLHPRQPHRRRPQAAAPAATPPPSVLPAEAEMSAADRRQVQGALRRLDYYKGPADGIFGPLTRAAIRRFQQDIRSDTTGFLTADQANRLVTPR